MEDGLAVKSFLRFQSRVRKVGLFLGVFEGDFAIGKKRYEKKFEDTLNEAYAKNKDCPIYIFSTLKEVSAFVSGFCFSCGKPFPL